MSTEYLRQLFHPASVAVIGASDRPCSVGAVVMRNLLAGGFAGPVMPVNPKHASVAAVVAYPNIASLPIVPDLAVICTPAKAIPSIICDLGERGTRAAIIITAGLERASDERGAPIARRVLEEARRHGIRLLGPNCVGLVVPGIGLNASFAHASAIAGSVAFVTQSGALSTAVLDFARSSEIGLSSFVSMGNMLDIDFADVLEYLADDPQTKSILLYVESVSDGKRFMSAARSATAIKPVIAVKAGRVAEGAKAAMSHTGAMAGSDAVFDAAFRQAGIVRVDTIEELFDSVETLALAKSIPGDRLAILTNGGGPGVMATDALVLSGGELAALSSSTLSALDAVLPTCWSRGNPIDIVGDAPPERYAQAMRILLDSPDCDAILFIQAPTAIVPSVQIAEALAPIVRDARKAVLTCWLGRDAVVRARQIFTDAGLPTYESPEDAISAFLHITRRHAVQSLRTQSPATPACSSGCAAARRIIEQAGSDGRSILSEPQAKDILAAFGIPVAAARVAASPAEAGRLAEQIGFPVVLKILSPDVTHKSDAGGVALNLKTAGEVRAAAEGMLARIGRDFPKASITGWVVEQMVRRPHAQELIVGVATYPVFGPVILFGQGGVAVEVVNDRAIALPPLDEPAARELIGRTRVARLLAGYRAVPPADLEAIAQTLVKVSQLLDALPQVMELDINPLLADEHGVVALDARMRCRDAGDPYGRMGKMALLNLGNSPIVPSGSAGA